MQIFLNGKRRLKSFVEFYAISLKKSRGKTNKFKFSDGHHSHAPYTHKIAGFDVPWTDILKFFHGHHNHSPGRRGGLMVSALVSGSSGPGSSPGRRHCVVFLGKTLYSHSAPLHPGV